jgi:murein DD-endopeptidase MepM/ murein hydrolase activator NlpD
MGHFMMKGSFLPIAALLCCTNSTLAVLPQSAYRAGGIAILPIADSTTQVLLAQQPIAIAQQDGHRFAVIGIPLNTNTDTLTVQLQQASGQTESQNIKLSSYNYPEQRLKIANKSQVNPDPEQLARYSREATEQKDIYQSFSPRQSDGFPDFIQPTQGRYSSPFGLKRFFNDEARAAHSGLDIAAPIGQTVIAPAKGVVVGVGDYFFNGKTILIDHGQGIISMLCHLSQIDVKRGNVLKQGQAIAQVGKTGRATGPHLHWGMSLNDQRVDPLLFLPNKTKNPED